MNSALCGPPKAGESDRQALREAPYQSPAHVRTTLIKTFLAATVTAAFYEAVKQFTFPHITVWQSNAVTVCLFGAVSTVAVYLTLRRRSELLGQVQTELTHRKRAEDVLRESEEHYRLLFERNLAGAFRGRLLSRRLLDCNDAYARILGYSSRQEALKGGRLHDFCEPAALGVIRTRLLEEKSLTNLEALVCRRNRAPVWVLENVSLIEAGEGEEPLVEGTLIDITERKEAEHALRESEEKYKALIETTDTGYVIIDTEGRVIEANPEYVRLTGRGALDEVIGHKIAEWTPPHDLARNTEAVRRCAEQGFIRNFEVEHVTGEGQPTPIEVNATVVPAAGGVRIVALCRDITDRRRAELALRDSEERYRLLFERNLAGVFRGTLLSRRILDCNDAYARILGYDSRQEALNCGKLHDFYEPAALELIRTRLLEEKALTNFEALVCRKNKPPVWVMENVSLIEAREGTEPLIEGTLFDISERKQAEQALAQERDLLRALMDNLPDYIYFKDRQSRFLRTNRAHAKAFGLSDPGQAVGKTDFDFFAAEHAQQAYDDEQELIRTGKPLMAKEEKETWPDGRVTWVSTTKMPFRDASGAIIGTFGVSHDITEERSVEEALSQSEERYRRLFERNLAAVFQGTLDGHILDCNNAYARILGYNSREEILCLEKLDYFYDAREGMAAVTLLQKEGSQTNFEIRLKRRDGSPVPVIANVTVADMGEGRPPLVEGTLIDITERKRAEEQTRLLTAAVESAANGIVIASREGRILWVNPAFTRLTGYPGGEVLGQTLRVLKSGQQDANFYQNLWQTILAGGPWRGELVNRRKDGILYTDETTITPVRDAQGAITHFIAVKQDVTERKRAEIELRVAKEGAEAASHAKSEFLACMSHEIRTPMNGIIGMTELALDTPLSPEQREYLTMAKDSADSLLSLIDDILDFSKIEAGKLNLDKAEFNLHDLLANTLRLLSVRASKKGLEVAWSATTGVPERVLGDAGRVRQVIVNLVGNGVKFTEKGEVVVSVEVESRLEEDILLHFTVRDTGIGIAPENQKAIFEAFTQVDSSMARRYGGTGLGLTISSRLVQMMEGKIWLESRLGEGSTFHFTARFGLPKGERAETPVRQAASLRGLSVLVVDDNSTNRKILDSMLKHWMMLSQLACSGSEGLSALEQAASAGAPFPLVLVDAQMPEMDGFTLAERIKQNPRLAGAIVMMLTSAPQRGDVARCRELGIAVYLVKPIRQSELLEAILAALGKIPAPGCPATVITRHTLREDRRKLQILLVEDSVVNQQLAARLLEKRGHIVTIASNGCEALALLKQSRFDLALMDVQMPVMDGFRATEAIRQEEASSGNHLPIIAMTAHAMQEDMERCLAAGMDAYISKPVHRDELTEMVERIADAVSPPQKQ